MKIYEYCTVLYEYSLFVCLFHCLGLGALEFLDIDIDISVPERGLRMGWFYCLLDMGHHTICMLDKTCGGVFGGVFALEAFLNQK